MGHKVHPIGFRLGVTKDWQSKWYGEKNYASLALEDHRLREYIRKRFSEAGIARVEIERGPSQVGVTLHTARPGIVIGRGGQRVEELRQELESLTGKRVRLNIQEIHRPEIEAPLIAKAVAEQIEKRVSYRRAMKQAVARAMQNGAQGIKIVIAGRLGGAEMKRRAKEYEGRVPLQTIRADIEYGLCEARTTLGRIGVKVWVYKGEILSPRSTVPEGEIATMRES